MQGHPLCTNLHEVNSKAAKASCLLDSSLPCTKEQGRTWYSRLAGEHSKYGGVRVIEGHSTDRTEASQVIFVGHVVAVPCNHIKRRAFLHREHTSG